MSVGLCLVTKGMVCVPYSAEGGTLLSCDSPSMSGTVEVRPKIRNVSGPTAATITSPVVVAASELKPVLREVDAPSTPDPDPKPSQTGAVELRPVIKKVEED